MLENRLDHLVVFAHDAHLRDEPPDDQPHADHRWRANLRVLDIQEVKTLPYVPLSHPFVERLIGTLRREYLDHIFFWNVADLERKLTDFQVYFNRSRVHSALDGDTPAVVSGDAVTSSVELGNFRWQTHCRRLYQLPVAA